MRLLAFADLHGHGYSDAAALVRELHPDWVVLVGDILPDFLPFGPEQTRLDSQHAKWGHCRGAFRPERGCMTFVRGNHELEGFEVPEADRQLPEAFSQRVIRLEGIPAEHGAWGWSREWEASELEGELARELQCSPRPAIALSHVPPFGLLDRDRSGASIGHRPLRRFLDAPQGRSLELVLCGHAHEARGALRYEDTWIVNVAGGFAVLDYTDGKWRVDQAGPLAKGTDPISIPILEVL